jgi:PTH1 family peptidyl-tRNA hydrolase
LGNPGREYRNNRHNIGFLLIDRLAERLEGAFRRVEMKALVLKTHHQNQRLILAKPQTFMNLSGQSVRSLIRYYKISQSSLLVAYDDVDLPLGVIRLRPSGGSAGQKGMQSIIERLGSQDFPRLRLGIGRPPGRMEAADYVLQDFSPSEALLLPTILDRGVAALLTFVTEGLDKAMTLYNSPPDDAS